MNQANIVLPTGWTGQPGQPGFSEMGNAMSYGVAPQSQPVATYTDYSQMNSVATNHMSQVGNVGFAETNSPTGQFTNQSQGWGGFQELPNQVVAGAGGGYVEGGGIHSSNAAMMSPSNDRPYCSQIYGQPGTGVHPSFTPPASQYIEPAAPPQPISVSTIPPEQKPKELELDEELYFWLVDQVRRFPSYPQWSDEVCKDDRVNSNPDLVTSILMSEDFFRSLEKKAKEG